MPVLSLYEHKTTYKSHYWEGNEYVVYPHKKDIWRPTQEKGLKV